MRWAVRAVTKFLSGVIISVAAFGVISPMLSELVASDAFAAETNTLEITRSRLESFSIPTHSSPAIPQDSKRMLRSAPKAQLSFVIPGTEKVALLTDLPSLSKSVSLPLLNQGGQITETKSVPLHYVTDYQGLFGVVAASENGIYAVISDYSAQEPYFIQISPTSASVKSVTHQVARKSAFELGKEALCGVKHDSSHQGSFAHSAGELVQKVGAQSQWRELQLVLVATSDFSLNRSNDDISAQAVSMIAATNVFYEVLELKVVITGLQIQRAGSDPYQAQVESLDAESMIRRASQLWRNRKDPEHDVIGILGGRSGYFYDDPIRGPTKVVGLAWTGTACRQPDYAVFFGTQDGTSAFAQLTFAGTIAHELGHTVGMEHDHIKYPQGYSIMYDEFIAAPYGFSPRSINDYVSHLGRGGDTCLAAIDAPLPGGDEGISGGNAGDNSTIKFNAVGVERIRIDEGSSWMGQLSLEGGYEGVRFSADGLPKGASLDPVTGLLAYTPGHDVARRDKKRVVQEVSVYATRGFDRVGKQLVFIVRDVNQAPVVTVSAAAIAPLSGAPVKVRFTAKDKDSGGKIKISLRSNDRQASGAKKLRVKGGRGTFSWNVPAELHGTFDFTITARDSEGGVTRKIFSVTIP